MNSLLGVREIAQATGCYWDSFIVHGREDLRDVGSPWFSPVTGFGGEAWYDVTHLYLSLLAMRTLSMEIIHLATWADKTRSKCGIDSDQIEAPAPSRPFGRNCVTWERHLGAGPGLAAAGVPRGR